MKFKFEYGENGKYKLFLTPYKTEQEKELLLIPMYTDNIDDEILAQALEICKVPLSYSEVRSLSTEMKIVMLYKYREISISDTLHLKFKCPNCGAYVDDIITISEIYKPPKKVSENIIDPMRILPLEDIDKYLRVDDNVPFSEYKEIKKNFNDYISHFNFSVNGKCVVCGYKNIKIDIKNPKFCIENMSENTINGLYSQINQMTHLSHYTFKDIMEMYPFERDILKGMLDKTIEKENEITLKGR